MAALSSVCASRRLRARRRHPGAAACARCSARRVEKRNCCGALRGCYRSEDRTEEEVMARFAIALLTLCSLWVGTAGAADLNPAAISYTLPDKIPWVDNGRGAKSATLVGD